MLEGKLFKGVQVGCKLGSVSIMIGKYFLARKKVSDRS